MREYIAKFSDEFVKQMKAKGMTDEFELIRCKDCKHYYRFDGRCYLWSINRRENGYCDRAERKQE